MAGGIRRSVTLKKLTEKERESMESCTTYLKNKLMFSMQKSICIAQLKITINVFLYEWIKNEKIY